MDCSIIRRNLPSAIVFFVSLLLFFQYIYGEVAYHAGYKYYRNYTYLEYDHHPQNWSIVQDQRGIIYAGNSGGVLVYDGVTWNLIEIPNNAVRSMAIGKDGRIYIGGINEFGYLAPDSRGFLKYSSLKGHFDKEYGDISDVWDTVATKEGVCFRTRRLLFRWNYKKIDFYLKGRYGAMYLCGGRLVIQQAGIGLQLLDMKNVSLSLLPGTEILAKKKVWMIAPYAAGGNSFSFLAGTNFKGLLVYKQGMLNPWVTEADDILKQKKISHGIRLSSGQFALATKKGGIVIINNRGQIEYIFNKDRDLQSNQVTRIMEDNLGNVWLTLAKGISRLEYRSPFQHYDYSSGLEGVVISVAIHKKKIYAGTIQGVYYLHPDMETFVPVVGFGDCWDLLSTGESLLAATGNGVYRIDTKDGTPQKVFSGARAFELAESKKFPGHIWCVSRFGLVALTFENNRWGIKHKLDEINKNIRRIVEDPDGLLWLITYEGDILRIKFPSGIEQPVITKCKREKAPNEGNLYMAVVNGHVVFASLKGLFRYNEEEDRFIPDLLLGAEYAYGKNNQVSKPVFRLAQDSDGNIWFHSKSRNYRAIARSGEAVTIENGPFRRIPIIQTNVILPESGSRNIWFGGIEGLIRYNSADEIKWDKKFSAIISKVFINDTKPGYGYDRTNLRENGSIPEFSFKDRNIAFQCGAPFFEKESGTRYRYKLDGYDNKWSEWTHEARKHYTNLDNGRYNFHVRAKNVYDVISKEDTFSFRILPPWYKTWWAFLLYAAGLLTAFNYAVKWRSRQLVREKEKLEQVVEERTLKLKEQAEKLEEMDKIKSRFFANISHEFRTPLTLIMSPLEQMLRLSRNDTLKKSYHLMLRNAQQLLTLINRLLELSRFDSGEMKLRAACQNIVTLLKNVIPAFQEVARQRKLTLDFHSPKDEILLYVDVEKMEEVMYNLLSNAVKFTPPGGRISVSLSTEQQFVGLTVKDTGAGIPQEYLGNIFDRFFQAGRTKDKTGQGTGIGLSLTKEIILLHHGKIEVYSGEGTEFVISLPIGKDHLSPEEVEPEPASGTSRDRHKEIAAVYLEEDEDGEIPESKETNVIEAKEDKTSILVVEDHHGMRGHIRNMLEPEYTIMEAVNGKDGIDKAKEFMPNLIISDIMMPETDGFELCGVIKKEIRTSHIPVILLTAKASEKSVIKGLEKGADDYIPKPFNEKILRVRIKNLIDLRRQMQLKIQREKMLLPSKVPITSQDDHFLSDFQAVIEKKLDDPDFNVDVLSRKLLVSRSTLFKKIQALTGETPNQFIQTYRLARGAQLLRENYGNVTEVAMAIGFSSPQYFAKCFKEKFHQSPKAYQASQTKTS